MQVRVLPALLNGLAYLKLDFGVYELRGPMGDHSPCGAADPHSLARAHFRISQNGGFCFYGAVKTDSSRFFTGPGARTCARARVKGHTARGVH